MCVKLFPRYLNLSSSPLPPIHTYTYRVIIALNVCSGNKLRIVKSNHLTIILTSSFTSNHLIILTNNTRRM